MKKSKSIETIAVHGSYKPDATGATNPPIYLSNAYQFNDTQHAADLFDLKAAGYIYTRLHNPTTTVLEETLSQLDGGVGAVAAASGHFAEFMLIASLAQAGDEIVASNCLYGGTHNMFANTFRRFGINVKFANQDKPETFEQLITDKTKAIFIESISNPTNDIPDFDIIAKAAQKHKVPLLVDNTCATPFLFKPKDIGAAAVVYSSTKFLSGHGDVMGGAVVDLGTFDWSSGRFPEFTSPDESYHGVVYAKDFGPAGLALKIRAGVMRDIGGNPSPFNSFRLVQGIQTLHVRMERHVQNSYALAQFLSTHPKVSWVNHPALHGNNNYDRVKKYFPKGAGALLTFGVKGGIEAGRKFIEHMDFCLHAANLGDVKTIVTHPASTTHRQLTAEELITSGISADLIRVSVGIEAIEDIKADFDNALRA